MKRFLIAALALFTASCGGGGSDPTGPQAPTVSITSPGNGDTVSGTVTIRAAAERADEVAFFVDGTGLGADPAFPYEASWDASAAGAGSHTLRVVATGGGGTASDQISVAVEEGGSSVAAELVGQAFAAGTDVQLTVADLVESAADAVFEASIQNGGTLTTTGTLTQSAQNPEQFTWSASPMDKLVVVLADGTRIEAVIHAFSGSLDGSSTDFRDFHEDFDFTVVIPGALDLRIRSMSGNPGKPGAAASPAGLTAHRRTVTGQYVLNGTTITVDLTIEGTRSFDSSFGSVELATEDRTTGTVSSAGGSITVDQTWKYHALSVDDFVEQFERRNASSAVSGGVTWSFQDLLVRGVFKNNLVSEPSFWLAQGALLRNGAVIGTVRFDRPAVDGAPFSERPRAEILLGNGDVVPLATGGAGVER